MITTQYNAKQTFLFYLIAAVLFGTYGGRVCPMLETLTLQEVFLHCGVVFLMLFVIRHVVSTSNLLPNTTEYARFDTILFFLGSLPFALFYSVVYEFTIDSNLKVIFGLALFGFFTGFVLDLNAKIKGLDLISSLEEFSKSQHNARQSMVKKAIGLVLVLLISLTITLSMVAVKDIFWLEHNPMYLLNGEGKISIIKEFIYIGAVLIGYSIYIMVLWSILMSKILTGHEEALKQVTSGQISTRIPVYLNDELGAVASMTNSMLDSLEENYDEIQVTRDAAIIGLSSLAESRDNETGAHIIRTQEYVKALAIHLSGKPQYQNELTETYIDLLYKSAPLHDVGKVGIPDSILLKPGKHTEEEFEIMKQHAQIGANALSNAEGQLGESSFLRIAKEIALTHHEKWDGSGYPNQLSGKDIPLSGRLMALADVYDALISKRVYKPAFSHDKAKQIIQEGAGQHFDPEIVDAFLAIEARFVTIAKNYKDKELEIV